TTEDAAKPSSIPPDELARLSDDVIAALKTVYDPEIPADIFRTVRQAGNQGAIRFEHDDRAALADRQAIGQFPEVLHAETAHD
ncbi:hypothetical protein SB758_40525, partial [Burkholderia sp. SIMBA_013]